MSKSNVQLYLFSQLPKDCKFRFETPDRGPIYTKSSQLEGYAVNEQNELQFISPNILVFPIYPFCLIPQEIEWSEVINPEPESKESDEWC